jgi:tetratricopeptide (TPR) repeat protein
MNEHQSNRYDEALDLFNRGEYERAALAFALLGDFRDSAAKLQEADEIVAQQRLGATTERYETAVSLFEEGEYAAALVEFRAILSMGAMEDITESVYNKAVDLLDKDLFDEALTYFRAIDSGYADTQSYMTLVRVLNGNNVVTAYSTITGELSEFAPAQARLEQSPFTHYRQLDSINNVVFRSGIYQSSRNDVHSFIQIRNRVVYSRALTAPANSVTASSRVESTGGNTITAISDDGVFTVSNRGAPFGNFTWTFRIVGNDIEVIRINPAEANGGRSMTVDTYRRLS